MPPLTVPNPVTQVTPAALFNRRSQIGKERLQEELFHTFRLLHEHRNQIVLAGNVPPGEIEPLEQRLVARFQGGLATGLQRSEFQRRLPMRKREPQLLAV